MSLEARRYATIELYRVDEVRVAYFERPNPLLRQQEPENIDPGIAYDLGSAFAESYDTLDAMLDSIRKLLDG